MNTDKTGKKLLEMSDEYYSGERPDNPTIVEWILHCRRSGMLYDGSVLYGRGGLDLGSLDEMTLVEVEEAYHTINKQR